MTFKNSLILVFLLSILSCTQESDFDIFIQENDTFDVLIKNGRVVDGITEEAYEADLLIRNDEIVYVGEVKESKITVDRTIDAKGKVVTPGFIDINSHADPLFDESMEYALAMGVTTVVIGQAGVHPSYNPVTRETITLAHWMDSLDQRGSQLNVAVLAGHSHIRLAAKIYENGTSASKAQVERMKKELQATLNLGCFGMSTGLEYAYGAGAEEYELIELAKIVGANNGIIMSHIRSKDDDKIAAAIYELIKQGAHARVKVANLKVIYGKGAERGREVLNRLEKARATGIDISADATPYLAIDASIAIVFPSWASTQAKFEIQKHRYNELREYLRQRVIQCNGPEAILFTKGEYTGKTLAEVAYDQGISYVDVLMKMGPKGAEGAFFLMDKATHNIVILDKNVMVASDGATFVEHPRSYGTFARIIESHVMGTGKLSLEDAIYKMATLPAKTMQFDDRGTLEAGKKADVLIFNPEEVHETGTYEEPFSFAEGFEYVFVNGQIAREKGQMSAKYSGDLLRSGSKKEN